MNKSTSAAVLAIAALALSTAIPVASAQSGILPDLGDLNPLAGSETFPASAELPDLSVSPLSGSAALPGSADGPLAGSSDIGSAGMAPLSTNLLGGSAGFTSSDPAPLTGSAGMAPLSTELDLLGGSAALPPLSAGFPAGSTAGIGGSAEEIGVGVSGSLTNGSAGDITGPLGGSISDGGSLAPLIGSLAESGIFPALSGSITGTSGSLSDPQTGLLGSLTGNGGSTGGSADVLTGSAQELTGVNGSLTAFTGSLANGSSRGVGSTNVGSTVGQTSSLDTLTSVEASVGPGLLPLMSLGGLGVMAGVALGATVQLPPLPGVRVPGVCDLPHTYIDQLADAGSAVAVDCPHPEKTVN